MSMFKKEGGWMVLYLFYGHAGNVPFNSANLEDLEFKTDQKLI